MNTDNPSKQGYSRTIIKVEPNNEVQIKIEMENDTNINDDPYTNSDGSISLSPSQNDNRMCRGHSYYNQYNAEKQKNQQMQQQLEQLQRENDKLEEEKAMQLERERAMMRFIEKQAEVESTADRLIQDIGTIDKRMDQLEKHRNSLVAKLIAGQRELQKYQVCLCFEFHN